MSDSRVLERRSVLRGRVIDVGVERVRLPNGRETQLEILRHPGAAAILPVTEEGEVVLIHQFRHAADGYLWELPAGTREKDEEPLACARRELTEETGLEASTWLDLGDMTPAPGYTNERIQLFLARDFTSAPEKRDDDELITEVRRVPVAEALAWAADGTVVDAKTIVALFRAVQRGLLATRRGAS